MEESSSEQKILHLIALDDDKVFLDSLSAFLSDRLYSPKNHFVVKQEYISGVSDFFQRVKTFQDESKTLALVICDLVMPEMNGLAVLDKLKKTLPDTASVILTGNGDLSSAIQAINNGLINQYILKPIENPDQFIAVINTLLENFYLKKDKERKEIEGKINLDKLTSLNKRVSAMQSVSEKIAYFSQSIKKLDLDEVLDLIMERIPPLFNAKKFSIFLFDLESNAYHLVRDNHIKEKAKFIFNHASQTPMQRAIEKNEVVIINDIAQSSLNFSGKAELGNSCIIVPFRASRDQSDLTTVNKKDVNVSNICGVLNLSNIVSGEDQAVMRYKANLIQDILGTNVSNAQLYKVFQETHKLAVSDGLTGLYNNRVFKEFLQVEYERAKRYSQVMSVVMADIDFFKKFNDKYSHITGDAVLGEIARMLKKSVRRSDILARYGGEEFAFILPQTSMERASCLIEKVREIIEGSSFTDHRLHVTMSFGIAQTHFPKIESEITLLEKADKALYNAKANGRNRVELYMEEKESAEEIQQ